LRSRGQTQETHPASCNSECCTNPQSESGSFATDETKAECCKCCARRLSRQACGRHEKIERMGSDAIFFIKNQFKDLNWLLNVQAITSRAVDVT
jgi:hypothetical protein